MIRYSAINKTMAVPSSKKKKTAEITEEENTEEETPLYGEEETY